MADMEHEGLVRQRGAATATFTNRRAALATRLEQVRYDSTVQRISKLVLDPIAKYIAHSFQEISMLCRRIRMLQMIKSNWTWCC